MNGPLKFLTARKILPLLDLLAKFKRVLACLSSPNFCVARKKMALLGMLANARKDHSSPLKLSVKYSRGSHETELSGTCKHTTCTIAIGYATSKTLYKMNGEKEQCLKI